MRSGSLKSGIADRLGCSLSVEAEGLFVNSRAVEEAWRRHPRNAHPASVCSPEDCSCSHQGCVAKPTRRLATGDEAAGHGRRIRLACGRIRGRAGRRAGPLASSRSERRGLRLCAWRVGGRAKSAKPAALRRGGTAARKECSRREPRRRRKKSSATTPSRQLSGRRSSIHI